MSESTLPSLDDLGAADALLVHHKCHGFEAAWKSWHGGDPPVLKTRWSTSPRTTSAWSCLANSCNWNWNTAAKPANNQRWPSTSLDSVKTMRSCDRCGQELRQAHSSPKKKIASPIRNWKSFSRREPGSLGSLEHYDVLDVVGRTPASRQDNQAAEPKGQQETTGWGDVEVLRPPVPNLGDAVAPTRLGEAAVIAARILI